MRKILVLLMLLLLPTLALGQAETTGKRKGD